MSDEPFVFGIIAVGIFLLPIALIFGVDEKTIFVLLWGLGFYGCLGGYKSASIAHQLEMQLEEFIEQSNKRGSLLGDTEDRNS